MDELLTKARGSDRIDATTRAHTARRALLLTSAATAYAECAWVLWAGTEKNPQPLVGNPIQWRSVEGYDTRRACVEAATETAKNPKNKAWEFSCLPDPMDPRGPKAKSTAPTPASGTRGSASTASCA
jgi:hypothetical protein